MKKYILKIKSLHSLTWILFTAPADLKTKLARVAVGESLLTGPSFSVKLFWVSKNTVIVVGNRISDFSSA